MIMRKGPSVVALIILAAVAVIPALNAAELRFSRHFGDGMVMQRDKPVPVTGFADKGAAVTVTFGGQSRTATADDAGAWVVTLDAMGANAKPQVLKASSSVGDLTPSIGNVVVGDVWLFARQTTIDISLGRDAAGNKVAAAHAKTPLLRAMQIATVPSATPRNDLAPESTTGWAEVTQESAATMSAAAYYFGRDLAAKVAVPVGVIDLNMGSYFPVGWLSREAQLETEKFYGPTDVEGNVTRMENLAALKRQGEPPPRKEVIVSDPLAYALYPAAGYNAVICPLSGMALKGIILQLGGNYPYMIYSDLEKQGTQFDRPELNRAYVETYNIRKVGFRMDPFTTPRIPREWREAFADQGLPMAMVMPPSSALKTFGEHAREMRELLRLMTRDNSGLGLILPGFENIPFSAQPRDEALLAKRSLSWALGSVYAIKDVAPAGPQFERMETDMNKATIHFVAGTAQGLKAGPGGLEAFEAAGVDGEYAPAEARIDGEVIRLKSDTVGRIAHVRYNWKRLPDQGLVNGAGLPAIPFRTQELPYDWFVTNEESDLPIEYSTPANEWKKNDVTLVNGQLKTHGYDNFTGWLGPVGVMTGPFGPNMGVREVKPGSPADGKLFVDDVIYSANGNMLGDKAWEVMGAAITDSETEEGGGRLVLGVRRDGANKDVEVMLEVMGTYSATAPYDCPKTEKIIANLKKWVVAQGADAGFLNTDALFMLATGDPEMQGYVRRIVYDIMAQRDPAAPIDPTKAGKSWHNSAEAILLAEYYMATGDHQVLPYLKHACDRLAATQNKEYGGWRHNFPGGATYGLIPNAGLPGVIGMHFARQAGLDIDLEAYHLGVRHFSEKRAESGFLIYGYGLCQREVPPPFDPEAIDTGHLDSFNGGLSAASILMHHTGNPRGAHLCSFISAYAWNNTFHGHGGNFWNNFWTPLGAHQHSDKAFIHFWKNYRWYRESNRMFDGSLIQHESGKVGAGCGVALVAPRERIQITGAPPSPFAVDAPAYLKPALAAHAKQDYAGCEKLVNDLLASGTVGKDDLPTVEYLARAAREIQESITADLARMHKLIDAGRAGEAKADLAQLKGVMAAGDERLAAIEKALAAAPADAQPKVVAKATGKRKQNEASRTWECLVTEIATDAGKQKSDLGKVPAEEATPWRIKIVEDLSQAPEDWAMPRFDDADWKQSNLPISWRMYHTALMRTTFTVEDKDAFDGLRFRGWLFRQQGIEIYLNGELIGKVNNLEKKTGDVEAEFKPSALKHLRNGENHLAITTRHNWRWGMLSMHVYNDGFGFRLDARLKDDPESVLLRPGPRYLPVADGGEVRRTNRSL